MTIEESPEFQHIEVLNNLIFEAYRYRANPKSQTILSKEPRKGIDSSLNNL